MKVAMVVPRDPPRLNTYHQVPIGSLYTISQLRRQGVEVDFVDLRVHETGDDVYARMAASDLAVVVSAEYDLAQCYPSMSPAAECVQMLKAAGASRVASVGSQATVDPHLAREFIGADLVIAGEFEFAVPDLVRSLRAGGDIPDVWPADGVRLGSEPELRDLGTPDYGMADMSRYFSEGFVNGELERVNSGLVLANRGCPFGCSFCYLFFGRRLRRRPVERTLTEIRTMRDLFGIRNCFFLDYTFTLDSAWVQSLCAEIEKAELDINWICQTRADCLDASTLAHMQRAGCNGVWLGIESPELEQRRYLGKDKIEFRQINEGVALIRDHGLNPMAFVMVGLPNETRESLQGLNTWLKDSQVHYSLSTFQRRHGTALAEAEGLGITGVWTRPGTLLQQSEFLGESRLRLDELGWFFEDHDRSPTRVANIMRASLAREARPDPQACAPAEVRVSDRNHAGASSSSASTNGSSTREREVTP